MGGFESRSVQATRPPRDRRRRTPGNRRSEAGMAPSRRDQEFESTFLPRRASATGGPRSSGPPAGKDQRGLHIGVNGGYVGLQSTRSARGAARQSLGFFLIFLNAFNCKL